MMAVQATTLVLIDFLMDLDAMLATDPSFISGKWIGDVRQWSDDNGTYADFLDYNAWNQVHLSLPWLLLKVC